MKNLITTRCDNRIKDLSDISHPIIKRYAAQCSADFMIMDHEPPSDSGDNRPHYRILKHYELHETYDRILHLDTDTLLSPHCPNLFDIVPYDKIGTIYEDKGSRRSARLNTILGALRKFDFIDWYGGYINTGVFMTSRCHRDIFQSINGEYWTGFGSDDVLLGYQIKRLEFEVHELPFQFNHMAMFSEEWNEHADRFNSNIIHYAGRGTFEAGPSNKVEQMRLDFKRWYK